MLTVCIPVYNTDIRPLVSALSRQAQADALDVEIRVYDDCSPDAGIRAANADIVGLERVVYREMERNLGRSAIRNRLAADARGQALLYIDGDMRAEDPAFLRRYYELHRRGDVVVGGVAYDSLLPGPEYALRWFYGHRRESAPASARQANPYRSFMTGNVMIPKQLMLDNPFDEQIVGYGHEDTLFGYRMSQQRRPVVHIDNPLVHNGLETSSDFFAKTRVSVANLVSLWARLGFDTGFAQNVKLLSTAKALIRQPCCAAVTTASRLFSGAIQRNLCGANPSLRLFDLYKLSLALESLRELKYKQ